MAGYQFDAAKLCHIDDDLDIWPARSLQFFGSADGLGNELESGAQSMNSRHTLSQADFMHTQSDGCATKKGMN